MFEYMDTHYEFRSTDDPLTRYYKHEIEEKQYANLDGPVSSEVREFKGPGEAGVMVRVDVGGGFALGPAAGLAGKKLAPVLGGTAPGMAAGVGPLIAVCSVGSIFSL